MNDYSLKKESESREKAGVWQSARSLFSLVSDEKSRIILASVAVLLNSLLNLAIPIMVGRAVDLYVMTGQFGGVLRYSAVLLAIFLVALVTGYFQTMIMGMVGQNLLFKLRGRLFGKIQSLPIAFFNQNKAGDLISRINNDTDKLNQFMSQGLVQFVANAITVIGAAAFIVFINWRLGLAALLPALAIFFLTSSLSRWIRNANSVSLRKVGALSAEIAESLENFKVVIAFDRRDYFRKRFAAANDDNYASAIKAGIANNSLAPAYGLSSNIALLIVVGYGIHLIADGSFTVGLLISFIGYVTRLYDPLRYLAQIWSSFQSALAGWERIERILSLETDLAFADCGEKGDSGAIVEFRNVCFRYGEGREVLKDASFKFERGKTYALVGPTGGGKTTTASLIARLFDPTKGRIFFAGRDIRCYEAGERAKRIGFILQDPFLFSGTVRDNLIYGNPSYLDCTAKQLEAIISEAGLDSLVSRFDSGLETPVSAGSGGMSLGQRQLVAFMRAVLRKPDLLILDEATANIDTVTEQLLEAILAKLSGKTTKVIIAHRLNTIANADEILFVNEGKIVNAGNMEEAVKMIFSGRGRS